MRFVAELQYISISDKQVKKAYYCLQLNTENECIHHFILCSIAVKPCIQQLQTKRYGSKAKGINTIDRVQIKSISALHHFIYDLSVKFHNI